MEILKFVAVSILCLILCIILRQTRPEFLPFAQIASVIVLTLMVTEYLKNLLEAVNEVICEIGIIEDGYIVLLLKVLGIAIVTKIASDICRDNGNSVLGTNVELAGKIVILAMCLSIVRTITELAKGLLG